MNENIPLATEIIHELKAQSRRWFIAFIIVLGLWFSTIVGFMIYVSLPVEEVVMNQSADNNSHNSMIGGDYNGLQAEYDNQETRPQN